MVYRIDYHLMCSCKVLNTEIDNILAKEMQNLSDNQFQYTYNHNQYDVLSSVNFIHMQ